LNAEPGVVLNATSAEMLNEPAQVGAVVATALDRAGPGLSGQQRITETFRRSGVSDELLDALVSSNPVTRASAARLCGALRLSEAVIWIEDLLQDEEPAVRDSAVRALAELGGRRAIEALMGSVERISLHRLAIALAAGATDIDIEALMRQPGSEKAATVTVLACGLRRDALRVAPLLGIAHDRRWPVQVRIAACRSLGMIGDPTAVGGMDILAEKDPDPSVKKAAAQAWRRLQGSKRLRPG
jgi:HEAT repeat protein